MFRVILLSFILAATSVAANSGNLIERKREVVLKVGQSVVVNGIRGECGKRPTGLQLKKTRKTKLGVMSFGRWGVKESDRCGGMTPAIEIVYTARKKGSEIVKSDGSRIKITVK